MPSGNWLWLLVAILAVIALAIYISQNVSVN